MALIWFPCYVNDLLGSFRFRMMTLEQKGAFWLLICWQMQSPDGKLPGGIHEMNKLAEMDLTLVDNACILEAFPIGDDGKRANPRAYREWGIRMEIGSARSESGKKGAEARWGQDGKGNGNANGKTDSKTIASAIDLPCDLPCVLPPTITSTSTGTKNTPQTHSHPTPGGESERPVLVPPIVAGQDRSETDPDIQNARLHYLQGKPKCYEGTVAHPETREAIRAWRAVPRAPRISDREAERLSRLVLTAEGAANAQEVAEKVAANEFCRQKMPFPVAMRPKNLQDILGGAYPPDAAPETGSGSISEATRLRFIHGGAK